MQGIQIRPEIGMGDALQFSSLPENYFRATGEKLIDITKFWFFDHNPYIVRDEVPEKITQMWNFGPKKWEFPVPREPGQPKVYLSLAEIYASLFKVPVVMNRPRLYRYEDYPFENRKMILLHTDGRSHGEMPDYIVQHAIEKYAQTGNLVLIGKPKKTYGLPYIETATLWDLAELISKARMLIGMDSGPSWIAACYPDVIVKKIRMKPIPEIFENWVPMEIGNIHSHWDDRCHQIYNPSDDDIGFTWSYRKI